MAAWFSFPFSHMEGDPSIRFIFVLENGQATGQDIQISICKWLAQQAIRLSIVVAHETSHEINGHVPEVDCPFAYPRVLAVSCHYIL